MQDARGPLLAVVHTSLLTHFNAAPVPAGPALPADEAPGELLGIAAVSPGQPNGRQAVASDVGQAHTDAIMVSFPPALQVTREPRVQTLPQALLFSQQCHRVFLAPEGAWAVQSNGAGARAIARLVPLLAPVRGLPDDSNGADGSPHTAAALSLIHI